MKFNSQAAAKQWEEVFWEAIRERIFNA